MASTRRLSSPNWEACARSYRWVRRISPASRSPTERSCGNIRGPSEGGGMQAITPVLYGDSVIVSSYQSGVKALRPARRDGKWTVDVAWQTKDLSMFLSNPEL